jgi:hypothetical protein
MRQFKATIRKRKQLRRDKVERMKELPKPPPDPAEELLR